MKDYQYVPTHSGRLTTYLYRVVVEREAEGWKAFCPALQSWDASVWCSSREAAVRHLHERIERIVAGLRERGEPIPEDVGVYPEPVVSITTG
jgi:predicted RNase H-like HicB family nuclease